jgi:hypothetical protein
MTQMAGRPSIRDKEFWGINALSVNGRANTKAKKRQNITVPTKATGIDSEPWSYMLT